MVEQRDAWMQTGNGCTHHNHTRAEPGITATTIGQIADDSQTLSRLTIYMHNQSRSSLQACNPMPPPIQHTRVLSRKNTRQNFPMLGRQACKNNIMIRLIEVHAADGAQKRRCSIHSYDPEGQSGQFQEYFSLRVVPGGVWQRGERGGCNGKSGTSTSSAARGGRDGTRALC